MSIWIVFVCYVFLSAGGLFLLKTGSSVTTLSIRDGLVSLSFSLRLLLGFLAYASSFLVSLYLMKRMKLSLFYPMGSGIVLILTCLAGVIFLQERIGLWQGVGIFLVLSGIIVMNLKI